MDGWGGGFWLRNVHFPRSSHGERQRVVFVYLVHVRHLSMDPFWDGWEGGRKGPLLAMIWSRDVRYDISLN